MIALKPVVTGIGASIGVIAAVEVDPGLATVIVACITVIGGGWLKIRGDRQNLRYESDKAKRAEENALRDYSIRLLEAQVQESRSREEAHYAEVKSLKLEVVSCHVERDALEERLRALERRVS